MRRDWMIVAALAVAVGATGWLVLRPAESGASVSDQRLMPLRNNRYVAEGWQHLGAGTVTLDSTAGELRLGGGPGLLWYAAGEFGDGTLELDFRRADSTAEANVYLRLPAAADGDDHASRAFAIRLGPAAAGMEAHGAVAGVRAPRVAAGTTAGSWHHLAARFDGNHLTVAINDTTVMDWTAAPGGPVREALPRGHLGMEVRLGVVEFRNVMVRSGVAGD